MHSFHPLDLDSFFFFLSLSFPSFFFLFIRSFASCYTTMMNSNIYRRFYKYTRKIYSSLLHFYLRSLSPPRYLIFFLSYSSSFFFFNVTGNRTREHKSEQNGRYPFNQDSFITWSNILVNFSPTFLRFLPFFPPLPLSSFFPL